jgi:hypothetical protein
VHLGRDVLGLRSGPARASNISKLVSMCSTTTASSSAAGGGRSYWSASRRRAKIPRPVGSDHQVETALLSAVEGNAHPVLVPAEAHAAFGFFDVHAV